MDEQMYVSANHLFNVRIPCNHIPQPICAYESIDQIQAAIEQAVGRPDGVNAYVGSPVLDPAPEAGVDLDLFVIDDNGDQQQQSAPVACAADNCTMYGDNTVTFHQRVLQLPPAKDRNHFVRCRVTVHEFTDATLGVSFQNLLLARYSQDGELIKRSRKRNVA